VLQTYVDDLEPLFEKLVGLVGEVVLDAILSALVGLVDMNAFSWAAGYFARCAVAVVGGCTANRVVENVDTRSSSAF
jgi:hypothetical protein